MRALVVRSTRKRVPRAELIRSTFLSRERDCWCRSGLRSGVGGTRSAGGAAKQEGELRREWEGVRGVNARGWDEAGADLRRWVVWFLIASPFHFPLSAQG